MFAVHDDLITLVNNFARFDHSATIWALGVCLFVFDGDARVDRVTDKNGLRKAQAVISISECDRVELASAQTDANSKRHRAVGDALAEGGIAREFRVHMMWEVVS